MKDLPGVILGEECHIVSSKKAGPRWTAEFEGDFDRYDNLILLCANDHTRIDSIPDFFPSNKLHQIKREHEQWVRATLQKDVTAFSNERFQIESLARIESGKQLFDILHGCHASQFDYPELERREEMETVAGFFQMMQDYVDILSEIEVGERIRVAFELTEQIRALREMGLVLFGSRREMKLKLQFEDGSKPPMDWYIATIAAVRPDNPSIFGDFMIAAFEKKVSFC